MREARDGRMATWEMTERTAGSDKEPRIEMGHKHRPTTKGTFCGNNPTTTETRRTIGSACALSASAWLAIREEFRSFGHGISL